MRNRIRILYRNIVHASVISLLASNLLHGSGHTASSISITDWEVILPVTYALICTVVILFTFLLWQKNQLLRREIASRTKAENTLIETQRFNERILSSTLDMVYIISLPDANAAYCNTHFTELLGYTEQELYAMGTAIHKQLVHPDDAWRIEEIFTRGGTFADETIESIEFRMKDNRNRWYWIQGRYTIFKRDNTGTVLQLIGTLHDITERVLVTDELKIAFSRAQQYLDIVETIILALDREGRVTLINRKGLQLISRESADIIGKNWFELCIVPEDQAEAMSVFSAMISGTIHPHEYRENRIITADGQTRTIGWHGSLLTNAYHQVSGLLSSGEDITLRKEAEEYITTDKLRQSMLLTLSQSPDLTIESTMDYALETALLLTKSEIGYLYFYSELRKEFNLYSWSKNVMNTCNVIEKQTVYQLDKTGLWGEAIRLRKPIITNDYSAESPFRKGLPEGHVGLRRHLNIPVIDDGIIVAVIGVANKTARYDETDIRHLQLLMDGVWKIKKRLDIEREVRELTEDLERKVALRTGELVQAHSELERFFTLTPDLLSIADSQGKFLRCNKAWEQILGFSLYDIEGMLFLDFVHPEDVENTLQQMNQLLTGDEVIGFTNRYRCADGSYRWIEWRLNAVNSLIYAAARDITEKKKNEEVLIRAKLDADRANHAKSYFLANMSHEIRTPLNAIIGYSELLSTMALDDKVRSYIDSIIVASRNLLRLINDILDLSKIEADMMSIHLEAVDIRILLREIEQIFSYQISKKQLAFSIFVESELPQFLMLDEVRLRQVLLNIVGNAVKFTDQGFIRLRVTYVQATQKHADASLKIVIEDSGIGIPPEEREKIFDAFHQQKDLSPRFGGTGLGLAISKKLIEMMNGTITVESEKGTGSSFAITLGQISTASTTPGEIPKYTHSQQKVFKPSTILIVDDVPSNRDILATMLNEAGLTVLVAQNGKTAVEIATKKRPACIIMDLFMPVIDGFSAAKILKTTPETASIPIIALTTLPGSTASYPEHEHLFAGKLCKPVSFSTLVESLKNHLALQMEPSSDGVVDIQSAPQLPRAFGRRAQELLGAVKTEDIRSFSNDIIMFGKSNGNSAAVQTGTILYQHAEHFDIEGVRKILSLLVSQAT